MPSNSPQEVGDFLIPDLPLPLLRYVTVIRPRLHIFSRYATNRQILSTHPSHNLHLLSMYIL